MRRQVELLMKEHQVAVAPCTFKFLTASHNTEEEDGLGYGPEVQRLRLTFLASERLIMSEKDLQKKLDRCLADCTVKLGAGLGLGIVFSVVFFKRRTWPITFGLGTGLGMAYTNCQNDLRTPYLLKRNMKEL
ncbi:MICOS complex subunit MIC10 [Esox lucius]|uniref:MICOS complex subunit MIC10 n=1 Tax=Esox lucius TaxID=8010 RepID=A0AAY5K0B5_ESOLU|nr:MICOS complex subunit MIC10 [Esox lucius]